MPISISIRVPILDLSLGNISKCCCALSQFSLFLSLNADPGNLQDSPVGAAGQVAIERPPGILAVLWSAQSRTVNTVGRSTL